MDITTWEGQSLFGYEDGSVINWRGENYVPQRPTLRVRLHNLIVRLINSRHDDSE